MAILPELIPELCNGCGLCICACHGGGIVLEKGKVIIVETANCDFCAVCEAVCPQGAVKCSFTVVLLDED